MKLKIIFNLQSNFTTKNIYVSIEVTKIKKIFLLFRSSGIGGRDPTEQKI